MNRAKFTFLTATLTAATLLVGSDDTQSASNNDRLASANQGGGGGQAGTPPAGSQSGASAGQVTGADRNRDVTGTAGSQTFTGYLLDASCSEIRNMSASGTSSLKSDVSDPTGGAHTGATGSGGSAGNPSATGRTGSTTGTSTSARGSTASQAGASSASQSGTTGTTGPDRASAQTGTTGSGTGSRATAGVGDRGTGPSSTATAPLPSQYHECSLKPSTTAYALYADGRVLRLDDASNTTVRQQLQSDDRSGADRSREKSGARTDTSGTARSGQSDQRDMHVQVIGTVQNGQLKITSFQRQDLTQKR